jgi:hypothetical protein
LEAPKLYHRDGHDDALAHETSLEFKGMVSANASPLQF